MSSGAQAQSAAVDLMRTLYSLTTCHLVSEPLLTSPSCSRDAGWFQGLLWDVEGDTVPEMHVRGHPLSLCSAHTFHSGLRDSSHRVEFSWSSFLKSVSGTLWRPRRWVSILHRYPLSPLPQPLPEDRAQHTVGSKKYFLMENCFPGFHAICLLSLCCEQKLEIHITDKEM